MATALAGRGQAGLDFLRSMIAGEVPGPPIANLLGMALVEVEHGRAVFTLTPDESMFNPIGAVHGGVVCTLLDSALGCALHTTLPAGRGYTSVEIKVSYLRAVRPASGLLTATGQRRRHRVVPGDRLLSGGRLGHGVSSDRSSVRGAQRRRFRSGSAGDTA
jgi:uncharacterized protein (TIGR00369 family)